MPRFASFKSAHKANAPDLLAAEIAKGKHEQASHANEVNMRRGNIAGAINLYDSYTGKDTPIKDYFSEVLREGDASAMQNTPAPVVDKSIRAGEVPSEATSYGVGVEPPITSGTLAPTATEMPLGFDTATGSVDPALAGGTDLPLGFDTATGSVDPALAGGTDMSQALRDMDFSMPSTEFGTAESLAAAGGTEAADAAGGGVPVLSALQGADQLARGDIAGAAGTGGKAWLASLGPYGMGAAALLGLFGVL